MKGRLYLIPTTLGDCSLDAVIPRDVQDIVKYLRYFIVENVRSARRYLRRIDKDFPIDDSFFFELNKHTKQVDLIFFISPLKEGFSIGLLSEAGCPAVADPGSSLVSLAHKLDIQVCPLVGPSSILLALMGSGFSGQQFTFHGYLPKEQTIRVKMLKEFETHTRKTGQTHIFMETPFRNNHLVSDLLEHLADQTKLCIASNLSTPQEFICTMNVSSWKNKQYDFSKQPSLFLLGVTDF